MNTRNVEVPGSNLSPIRRAGTSTTELLLYAEQPERLRTGRLRLRAQLEYRCGGETIFEMTDPVFFWLVERDQ